jgi:hypothetical protein
VSGSERMNGYPASFGPPAGNLITLHLRHSQSSLI